MADVKDAQVEYVGAFDAQAEMACVCDAGFRGPACDQVECPSQADPLGGFGADGSTTPGSSPSGPAMDCSGRGVCDYALGQCDCFKGEVCPRCMAVPALSERAASHAPSWIQALPVQPARDKQTLSEWTEFIAPATELSAWPRGDALVRCRGVPSGTDPGLCCDLAKHNFLHLPAPRSTITLLEPFAG